LPFRTSRRLYSSSILSSAQLYLQGDNKIQLATRDKTIYDMGYKPTKEYIESTYNITVEEYDAREFEEDIKKDIKVENKRILKDDNNAFKGLLKDDIDKAVDKLLSEQSEEEILQKIESIFESCETYEEAQEVILEHYKDLNFEQIEKLLAIVLPNAALFGSFSAK
jgi:phage gp29-like protein